MASTDVTGGGRDVEEHKQQAKAIVKRLNSRSPSRMSIDSGTLSFKCVHARGARRGSRAASPVGAAPAAAAGVIACS